MTRAALVLCLPVLLTSCNSLKSTPAPFPVSPPPIDAELTEPTGIPPMPMPFLWRSSLLWNADLLLALGQCNRDKASIREQDNQRKEIYERRPGTGSAGAAP
ncbi:peptidase [Salmonella enterica]|nr:peptidase [Salmonella enterica]